MLGCEGMGAVFNLNSHATYLHWNFIDVSLSNVLVVVAMLVVFAVAILAPFPHGRTLARADTKTADTRSEDEHAP
jgi:hypothetical protein